MKQDIQKAIDGFSRNNKDLAKILTLFVSNLLIIIAKHMVTKVNDEFIPLSTELMKEYDKN